MNQVSRFLLTLMIAASWYSIELVAQESAKPQQAVKEPAKEPVKAPVQTKVEPKTPAASAPAAQPAQAAAAKPNAPVVVQPAASQPVVVQPAPAPVAPTPAVPAPVQQPAAQPEQAPEQPAVQAQETTEQPAEAQQEEQSPESQEEIYSDTDTYGQQQEHEDTPLGSDEVMGIDTVDLEDPQGNWLYKRVWWERAEAKYEKIRAEVGKIMESRTGFFARRADLDKNVLDPFYIKVGLSQGELQEILKGLIEKAEKGVKDQKNENLLEKAQEDKKELEKLQEDVKNVVRQDEELENAVMMLVNQISKLRAVEQQAWQDFKSIARVLDDRKARELFYKVDNGWRNVQELSQYLQGSFSTSFDQLIERIKTLVTTIDGAVATLKEKGVELKARSNESTQEDQEEQEEEPKGLFTRYVIDPVKGFFWGIWSVIRWPYDAVMGLFGKAPEPEDEDLQAEPVAQEATDQQPAAQDTSASIPVAPAQEPAEQPQQEPQDFATDDFEMDDDQGANGSDLNDYDDLEGSEPDSGAVDELQETVEVD